MDTGSGTAEPREEAGFAADYLGYLLARASFRFNAVAHGHAKAAGLSVLEWRVLATLSGRDRLGVGALAAAVLYQQPTLTKALDRMVEKGLVVRSGSPADRRVVHVSITAEGRARIEPVLAATRAFEQEVLGEWAPGDAARLKALLQDLVARLAAREDAQRR